MRRRLLLFSAIACLALGLAPVTTASNGNKPDRRITLEQGDGVLEGPCAFPVLAHIDGREIDTTFGIRDRTVMKLLGIFPGNTWTLTNLDNGKSIAVGSTSSFHQLAEPDGSFSVKVVGRGVWPFENPLTLEPGIWYQHGQVSGVFDANGNQISTKGTGSLVNLCSQLS
jgi:hypothetical protein